MAKQQNIQLSGRVDNLIFYQFRGTPCVRTMPAKVRQTKATKKAATIFGRAVGISAQLRSGLNGVLDNIQAIPMRYDFDLAVRRWIQQHRPGNSDLMINVPFIDQFQFSAKASLNQRLKKFLPVDWQQPGKIILHIPDLVPTRHISAPPATKKVTWKIAAVGCTTEGKLLITGQQVTNFDMDYDDKEVKGKDLEFPFMAQPGNLIILVVALKFTIVKKGIPKIIKDENWSPADVVGSCFVN